MSESDAAQPLALSPLDAKGRANVAWCNRGGSWLLLTANEEGKLSLRSPADGHAKLGEAAQAASETPGQQACKAMAYDATSKIIAAGHDTDVKLWTAPALEYKDRATRFTLPVVALSFSRDGSRLMAASEDATIKIIAMPDPKVLRNITVENQHIRALSADPEGTYVAAATADGTLLVYTTVADSIEPKRVECRKRVGPRVGATTGARLALAWHPEGALLGMASTDNDVQLFERLSWSSAGYLSGGGHGAPVEQLAFSPNGLYAATGASDGTLAVFRVQDDRSACIARRTLAQPVASLAWCPQANELAVGGAGGGVGVWRGVVPTSMPSCWQLQDERTATAGAHTGVTDGDAGALDSLAHDGGVHSALDDAADGAQQQPRRARRLAGDALASLGDEDSEGDGHGRAAAAAAARPPAPRAALQLPRQQPAIAPGSTPWEDARGDARFLAYTRVAALISRKVGSHHSIDVVFHSTTKRRGRVPSLIDPFGYDLGVLGPLGAMCASPASEDSPAARVLYRPFESWAPNSEWSAVLPEGEVAVCLAAGASFAAAATSAHLLRVWTLAGVSLAALALPGAPVAAAAHDHLLALTWHEADPAWQRANQHLQYAVYDMRRNAQLFTGRLPLCPGATLTWLAFTAEGALAALDSSGRLCVRGHEFGGAWAPVWSAAEATAAAGGGGGGGAVGGWWPVALSLAAPEPRLFAVATPPGQPHPAVHPPPVLTPLPLRVALAVCEGSSADLEGEVALRGMGLAHTQWLEERATDGEGVAPALDAAALRASAEAAALLQDAPLLKLLLMAIRGERLSRAYELAAHLHSERSLQGALSLANHHHQAALAQRISLLLEERVALAEQARAEAAEAGAGAYWRDDGGSGGGGGGGGGAVADPPHLRSAGGSSGPARSRPAHSPEREALDVHSQPDQSPEAEQRREKSAVGDVAADGRGRDSAQRVAPPIAPLFNRPAKQAGAGGAGGGGAGALAAEGLKRKAAAVGGGGGGGGGNPFARKKPAS